MLLLILLIAGAAVLILLVPAGLRRGWNPFIPSACFFAGCMCALGILAFVAEMDVDPLDAAQSISNNAAEREAVVQVYADALQSHDKHRITSARAMADAWNGEVDYKKRMKDSIWIGAMYPDAVVDALEYVEVVDE